MIGKRCFPLLLSMLALPAISFGQARAETEGGAGEPPPCDYDINADCRTRDEPPRRQDREGAPVDLTGYWVSVVTEDWRWRMMTPPKGDIASLPLNVEGERATLRWDPATESDTCKAFGAAGLMRNPMRVRLEWEDDKTLRLETDHGMQTRRFHFDPAAANSARPSLRCRAIRSQTGRRAG